MGSCEQSRGTRAREEMFKGVKLKERARSMGPDGESERPRSRGSKVEVQKGELEGANLWVPREGKMS